jgi:hypothetical protein
MSMALYAYNLTGLPVTLAAGNPIVTIDPSPAPPLRGKPSNITSKLVPNLTVDPINGKSTGLSDSSYALLQAQVLASSVAFVWTSSPEYLTPGLFCESMMALQVFNNTTRPPADDTPIGTTIYNTDDRAPNWCTGVIWVDAYGNRT